MHPTQSQLCADHFNFLRLLRALELEIACYEAASEGRLGVILDIFDYVQVYPEKWHHPIEDAAFEMLLKKQADNSDVIWGVRAEHKALEEMTHKVNEMFIAVANDTIVPVDKLVTATKEFVARQLDHINSENRLIYPLFNKYLSDQDWNEITEKVQSRRDPLFNEELCEEYRSLYKSILRGERGTAMGATARAVNGN